MAMPGSLRHMIKSGWCFALRTRGERVSAQVQRGTSYTHIVTLRLLALLCWRVFLASHTPLEGTERAEGSQSA